MDRIDLFIEVPAVKYEKLTAESAENQSDKIRKKIENAREKQKDKICKQPHSNKFRNGYS